MVLLGQIQLFLKFSSKDSSIVSYAGVFGTPACLDL